MKRLIAASALLALALTLFSCAGARQDDFDFSGSDIATRVIFTAAGESQTVDVRRVGDGLTLVYVLPERLEGMTVKRSADGNTTLSCGEVEVPVNKENPAAEALYAVFSVTPRELKAADAGRVGGTDLNRLTFGTDGKELILYILPDGKIPVRAEGALDGEPFTLDFTEFEYLPSPETE